MFGFRQWRRQRILRRGGVDDAVWQRAVNRFSFAMRLTEQERKQLRNLVVLFLHEKQISAAGGLVLDQEMKVGIAIQACILVLNLGIDYYDGWVEIIVYPDEFVPRREIRNEHGLVETDETSYAGQAWLQGPVILSWADVENAGDTDGVNVVIHEFAHKLDMRQGDANGFPPLHAGMSKAAWKQAFSEAYGDFCERVDAADELSDQDACEALEMLAIDPYAAESPGEFFAVVSEAFFETPELLEPEYPAVYEQLRAFYRQDPGARLG
jgi:Mlc titration factor MtfA (ptsG expression regulator)